MANVSVPGAGGGQPIVLQVSGQSSFNYAASFQNAVFAAQGSGNLVINDLSDPTTPPTGGGGAGAPVVLNEVLSDSVSSTYAVPAGGEYTLVDASAAIALTGSVAGADTVLAGGGTSYAAVGSGNVVTFDGGDNSYSGSSVPGAGGDTITAGSGSDTIDTGTGSSTVFGGGNADITLSDTVASGDVAYLGDGQNVVNASGVNDVVVTGTSGQAIDGTGATASSSLVVVIGDNATATGASADTIMAGSGSTTVFDSVGGASVFGGGGSLTFVGQQAAGNALVADTISGSSGAMVIFASSGNDITFSSDASDPVAGVVASSGNETLDGGNALGGMNFFGSTDVAGAASVSDSVIGGNGTNYFQTGVGSETLTGGTGVNVFGLQDLGAGSHVTVNDFASGTDYANFLGNDSVGSTMAVGSQDGTPTLTVTFADQSTVEFVGIASLGGHTI